MHHTSLDILNVTVKKFNCTGPLALPDSIRQVDACKAKNALAYMLKSSVTKMKKKFCIIGPQVSEKNRNYIFFEVVE